MTEPVRKLRPDDPKDCSECRAMADGLCAWHSTERKLASPEFAAVCQRIFARQATIADMLAFITTELEDALRNITPADRDQSTSPEGLWVIDEWHGSACVSRAYSMLFQLTDRLKKEIAIMVDTPQRTGDKIVADINQITNIIGTFVPTIGAIGSMVRLIATAVRPTDAQKAQVFDAAIADYDAAKVGLDTAIDGFKQAKAAASVHAQGGSTAD
jgi:hypothetical protein